jgi:hypothetical protein
MQLLGSSDPFPFKKNEAKQQKLLANDNDERERERERGREREREM